VQTCALPISRLARRRLAAPGEQDARVVALHSDAAGVGQGPLRSHTDRRPRLAPIVAPEDLSVRAHEHAGGTARGDRHVVDVEVAEPVDDLGPRVAAVET